MSAMQVSGGGVTAISFAYNHDARGRITSITDLAAPPPPLRARS
jgi:hypothetical protein